MAHSNRFLGAFYCEESAKIYIHPPCGSVLDPRDRSRIRMGTWKMGILITNSPDVIRVCLKHLDLVHGVVIVDPDEHVVRPCDDPLLAGNELGGPHWQLAHLE